MSSNYDYISVSSDSELIDAFTKVMSASTNEEIKIEMSIIGTFPYQGLANAARQLCSLNTEIRNLVNSLIKQTRTKESLERQRKRQEYV